jgi:putrescine aminotransferase
VATIAAMMQARLSALRQERPDLLLAVRGRGLLWGIRLASADATDRLVVRLAQQGLLLSPCMSQPTTLRLLPPLVASDAEVEEALDILDRALH